VLVQNPEIEELLAVPTYAPAYENPATRNAFKTGLSHLPERPEVRSLDVIMKSPARKEIDAGVCPVPRADRIRGSVSSMAIIGSGDAVLQGRDGGIGVFQPKTWADGDNFTCFGGRRWGEYLRRNEPEVLSALSSAGSIASTTQQMSISFGVAAAALTTAFFVPSTHSDPIEMIYCSQSLL